MIAINDQYHACGSRGLRMRAVFKSKGVAKAIVDAALDSRHPSELCLATVDLLVSILASEAGNLALKVLATGGVYLAGNIALHLVKLHAKTAVRADFHQKRPLQRFNGANTDSHHHHTCSSRRSCHIRTGKLG